MNIDTETHTHDAILLAGGPSAVARHFSIKPWAVSKWERAGKIPAERVPALVELISYQVTPHQLRPDVFIFPTDGIPEYERRASQNGNQMPCEKKEAA